MQFNLKEKFLPIGTVVLLKGGSKRMMITGYVSVSSSEENKLYDYTGCMYPEGYMSSEQNFLFNHNQIEKVFHIGYIDDENMKFRNQLKEMLPKIEEKVKNNGKSFPLNFIEETK